MIVCFIPSPAHSELGFWGLGLYYYPVWIERKIGMQKWLIFRCRQGGIACMPAAKLALEDVNGDKNLLPGFKLILHSNDSEVSRVFTAIPANYKL